MSATSDDGHMWGHIDKPVGRTGLFYLFLSIAHAWLSLFGFVAVRSLQAAAHVVTAN